jgi:hypothetical protein
VRCEKEGDKRVTKEVAVVFIDCEMKMEAESRESKLAVGIRERK